jgi:hypothetical protein
MASSLFWSATFFWFHVAMNREHTLSYYLYKVVSLWFGVCCALTPSPLALSLSWYCQIIIQEGEETIYQGCDTVCKATTLNDDIDMMYEKEFLNNLKFPGIPNNVLRLTIGLPVMLMRNINQSEGLWNGTRMTITQLGRRFIEAQIITGTHVGDKVYIPKLSCHQLNHHGRSCWKEDKFLYLCVLLWQ